MMTLSLSYAFLLLLCNPLRRINSPLFLVLVKGPFCWHASIFPIYKIHHSQRSFFPDLCPIEKVWRLQIVLSMLQVELEAI